MNKILTALAIAALMIGSSMATAANLISESVGQSIFYTLLGLSVFVITRRRGGCASCSVFGRGRNI